jgi:transcription termination/antitermination protein NusG
VHISQSGSWYALHVRTRHERTVANSLSQLQVLCFLPTIKVRPGCNLSVTRSEKPLFPGYLFCYTDLDRGPRLYNIPGIIKIVGNSRTPLPVKVEEIESIRIIASSNIPIAPFPFLSSGDEVVVVRGPLCGIRGVYMGAHPSKDSLVVSFALLRRSIKIQVEPDCIEPIGAGTPKYLQLAS